METDATYKIAVERHVREHLTAVAAQHEGLRARGLGLVLRDGRTEIASVSLQPLRSAGGWAATLAVQCPQALAFCQQWADGTPTTLLNPQLLMATTSSGGGMPGFADQSGAIVRAGTRDADALALHLVERLSASGLARVLAWRTASLSLIDDVVAHAAFYAWPLQTVLYIAHRNGLHADDPRLHDALQRRAIMRRGQRDRALVEQVLPAR
ncbi:hypothetical protein [Stenotrophomonas sp.]|uniref:hypothetical protein n=1 Tax=Stenotrophomonas sp. TaxID=69392 RepID=UPI0028AD1C6E|nr:hypothetical protein [Stenotrophomonas sp.]